MANDPTLTAEQQIRLAIAHEFIRNSGLEYDVDRIVAATLAVSKAVADGARPNPPQTRRPS